MTSIRKMRRAVLKRIGNPSGHELAQVARRVTTPYGPGTSYFEPDNRKARWDKAKERQQAPVETMSEMSARIASKSAGNPSQRWSKSMRPEDIQVVKWPKL